MFCRKMDIESCKVIDLQDSLRIKQLFEFISSIAIVNAVLAFLAIAGNTLVLIAIWKTRSLHSPSNILLSGLALCDLGVGLIAQPSWIILMIAELQGSEHLLSIACEFNWLSANFLLAVSFLTLTAISVDRFVAIKLHLRYYQLVTKKRALSALGIVWILCLFFDIWSFYDPVSSGIFSFVFFVIVLLVIAGCYWSIFAVIRKQQNQILAQSEVAHSSKHTLPRIIRYKKFVNTMLLVFGCFVICFFPLCCEMVVSVVVANKETEFYVLRDIFLTFLYLNSCLNPLLYCWRIEEIRHSVKKIMKK